ncbi:UreD-domain-containing protein [Polychaeton citri CBS 116435]|uniref:UreD-domain-containing protein n=1 Tax=Polychaeton citri CBS 116435 TaxID=1314669 RepID=A0A9P4USF9_9PEZI|nr:UreD-domain-containing protein [Polychaeton citri CBS 116435]
MLPSTNANPFHESTSTPGHGSIHLALLPPSTPRLQTVQYQYPLKLISPDPVRILSARRERWREQQRSDGDDDAQPRIINTVYLLTYGGGLVAGDSIHLNVRLERATRLILLTQGSTKIFKSPSRGVVSGQCMIVDSAPGSALCYLPDPVQPFDKSCFHQQQVYNVALPEIARSSLCVLDWVCNGRAANGENWSFHQYASRNEIYLKHPDGRRKLLLRDNLLLDSKHPHRDASNDGNINVIGNCNPSEPVDLAAQMDSLAIFGTLILQGPLFDALGTFFLDEFRALPRIGGRHWDGDNSDALSIHDKATRRAARLRQESRDNVLWSAASVRGCTVVKIGANSVEGGKRWLNSMLSDEGTVPREFGERSLLCMKQ